METIPKSECTKIAFIQKPHGINGEVLIRFQERFYESLEDADCLFLEIEGLLVPYFYEEGDLRFRTGESAIVKLSWVDSEEKAKELSGLSVYLRNNQLVLEEDDFEIHDIIGYLLIDQRKNKIGEILNIVDYSGNMLLELKYLNDDILIPFNEDFLIRIDPDQKIIEMDIPDGLLNLDEIE